MKAYNIRCEKILKEHQEELTEMMVFLELIIQKIIAF